MSHYDIATTVLYEEHIHLKHVFYSFTEEFSMQKVNVNFRDGMVLVFDALKLFQFHSNLEIQQLTCSNQLNMRNHNNLINHISAVSN